MSKKFLTVFALVALLVAAMAGVAFAAANDVTSLDKVGVHFGVITKGTLDDGDTPSVLPHSVTAYYLKGAAIASMDATVKVTLESLTDGTTIGISADKISGGISFDVTVLDGNAEEITAAANDLEIVLGGFGNTMPTAVSIDKIGVWTGMDSTATAPVTQVARLDIAFKEVKALSADSAPAISVSSDFTSKAYSSADILNTVSFDFGALTLKSGDTAITATAVELLSADGACVTVSFDNGTLYVERAGTISSNGTVSLDLYAASMTVKDDDDAVVAGFDETQPVAAIIIKTVGKAAENGNEQGNEPGGETETGSGTEIKPNTLTDEASADVKDLGVTIIVPEPDEPAQGGAQADNTITAALPKTSADGAAVTYTVVAKGKSYTLTDVAENEGVALLFDPAVTAFQPVAESDTLYEDLNKSFDILYSYVDNSDTSFDYLVGPNAAEAGTGPSWKDAYDQGIVSVDETGKLALNYVVVNSGDRRPSVIHDAIVIYDGNGADGQILDPLSVVETKTSSSSSDDSEDDTTYTSDSGCNAGFGAFALLGLAGAAAVLRRKD